MANNGDLVLGYLRAHPQGADDDELSAALGIRPRQQVNQICRRLETQGRVLRAPDPARSNKIVNRIVELAAYNGFPANTEPHRQFEAIARIEPDLDCDTALSGDLNDLVPSAT